MTPFDFGRSRRLPPPVNDEGRVDLSPNPYLPPLERHLQRRLLTLAAEFGGIARDLCLLIPSDDRLRQWHSLWSDAHEAAYTRAVNDPTHGHQG